MARITFHKAEREKRRKFVETTKAVLERKPKVVFAFLHRLFLPEASFRDINVGVFLASEDPSGYLHVELGLSQEIETSLDAGFPEEVKIVNEAPSSFHFNTIQGQLLFTRDDDILVDFMTTTAKHYPDFAPLRHRYMKEAMAS